MTPEAYQVEEKVLEPVLIAGVRMKGKYSECGKGFAQLGQRFGRHIHGNPIMLIYDTEYKEEDADFEVCVPIRKGSGDEEISVRELPGGPCVSLLHKGPYEELGGSYERLGEYLEEKDYEILLPSREVFLKGPGMLLKGNPKNYLTEIQMLIQPKADEP